MDGVYDAATGKLYLASLKNGLIIWDGKSYTSFNSSNSPLQSSGLNPTHTPVTSIARDLEGNIWLLNPSKKAGAPGLFKLTPDNEITSHTLPGISDASSLEQILIDDNG